VRSVDDACIPSANHAYTAHPPSPQRTPLFSAALLPSVQRSHRAQPAISSLQGGQAPLTHMLPARRGKGWQGSSCDVMQSSAECACRARKAGHSPADRLQRDVRQLGAAGASKACK